MRRTLDLAASATVLVTLPAAMGLILLADDVIDVPFVGGRFGPDDRRPRSRRPAPSPDRRSSGWRSCMRPSWVEDPATPARTAGQMVLLNAAASVTLPTPPTSEPPR